MNSVSKIGLIAVWNEIEPLLKLIDVENTTEHIQARFHRGTLAQRKVILAQVGMGKVQTAAASQYLIDTYGVDILISCGSAGSLIPQLQIGDIVLADQIVPHDFGEYTDEKFNYLGVFDNTYVDGLHYHRHLSVDPALLNLARQTAISLSWPRLAPAVHVGCVASGDQIIASEGKKRWLSETFNAIAVEMESVAMAQVAFMNDIPWLAVRAISDQADSSIDIDYTRMITYSDETNGLLARMQQTASNLSMFVRNPALLKSIVQVGRGIIKAARNAAHVTAAIIEQL